jgi:glutamate dehydrogenase/leucine dehydrogenase
MVKKTDIVQIKNPVTKKYIKVDRKRGIIVSHKKTVGPYKSIKIIKTDNQKAAEYKKLRKW